MPNTILLVDNDIKRREQLRLVLEFIDYGEVAEADYATWSAQVEEEPELIILGDGEEEELDTTLATLKDTYPTIPLLLVQDRYAPESEGVHYGSDVVTLIETPFKYRQIIHALHLAEVYHASQNGPGQGHAPMLFRSLVGNSRAVRRVRALIEQVADSEANVMILGESGTGKEVVARNLHYFSSRRNRPFVPVNCGAIPPDLLESELFGHEKGAFTGAISARQGRFEMAEGGTLFLDEIGDMPLAMQVKLLRVLQERVYERVGSNKSMKADVRIIAATHRDLETEIDKGHFREDLYYRLNVFPIDMPPLRERIEDIPLLVEELISRLERERRGSVRLTPAAIAALCHYPWPGNVRELANLMERLVIMYPYGVVDVRDLPEKFRSDEVMASMEEAAAAAALAPVVQDPLSVPPRLPTKGLDLKEHLTHMELSLIKQALDESGGVVAHAAKRLKMRRTTLVEKMRKYGLHRSEQMSGI